MKRVPGPTLGGSHGWLWLYLCPLQWSHSYFRKALPSSGMWLFKIMSFFLFKHGRIKVLKLGLSRGWSYCTENDLLKSCPGVCHPLTRVTHWAVTLPTDAAATANVSVRRDNYYLSQLLSIMPALGSHISWSGCAWGYFLVCMCLHKHHWADLHNNPTDKWIWLPLAGEKSQGSQG